MTTETTSSFPLTQSDSQQYLYEASELRPGGSRYMVPAVQPTLLPKTQALQTFPYLAEIERLLSDFSGSEEATLHGAIFDSQELQPLFENAWVGDKALLVFLPAEFEGVLGSLVSDEPLPINFGEQTHAAFRATVPDNPSCMVHVCVDMAYVNVAMHNCGPYQEPFNGPVGKRLPVIMVAGATVAVGGHVIHDEMSCNIQAAGMSAQSDWPWDEEGEEEAEGGSAANTDTSASDDTANDVLGDRFLFITPHFVRGS